MTVSLQGDSNRFQVQLTYETKEAQDKNLEASDMMQFLKEAENKQW